MKIFTPILILFVFTLVQNDLLAAGFEKTVQWSAKQSARAGAVSSSVEGADALYYNPAGLNTSAKENWEISANITPTLSEFDGPIVESNKQVQGNKTFKTPFALLSSYRINSDFAMGAGVYSSGGTAAEYKRVDYTAQNSTFSMLSPDIVSNLAIIEGSLGFSYNIKKNFKVGAAYRVVHIRATMASASTTDLANVGQTPDIITGLELNEIKDTRLNGYRLGLQYQTDSNNFGFGMMYRSAVKFKGKGEMGGSVYNSTLGMNSIAHNSVTVENVFPQQLDMSIHYVFIPEMTLFLGYTWTEYSINKNLKLDGTLSAGPIVKEVPDIKQDWFNMHNFRIALEDRHIKDYALRLGYVYTTQVTNENAARATFSSPGPAHTTIFGMGTQFLDKRLDVDGAFECSFASGRGKTTDVPSIQGKFQSTGYSAYISTKYRF